MGTSYAYDVNNIGHKYINSPQLDEDLKECADDTIDGRLIRVLKKADWKKVLKRIEKYNKENRR